MSTPRHDFYETDERLTLSIYLRGVDPEQLKVDMTESTLKVTYGDSVLNLSPLKGNILTGASEFSVGKVKVEVRLAKATPGRWGALVKDGQGVEEPSLSSFPATTEPVVSKPKPHKNWEAVSDNILKAEKDKTTNEDPNAGGDAALNGFFQTLFKDADDDSKRAMMKSFTESGGTTLSTNWGEVGKGPVEVKAPEGSTWRQWG